MMSADNLLIGVTGANGFIGRALCSELEARGLRVRRLVRSSRLDNTPDTVVVGDIGPATDWRNALQEVDVIVHCAAHVHQMGAAADDTLATYRRVNTEGTSHLARNAADAGVRRFIFISSVKVLGEETTPGQSFHHASQAQPTDPYGVSKWEAEKALRAIESANGMDVVVIRPPLVYGPGVGANFMALMRLVAKGWPLPFGNIKNQRSMVALGNLVDLISICTAAPETAGQTFMVSDDEDLSTPALVRAMAQAMGVRPRLWPVPVVCLNMLGRLTGRADQVQRLTTSLQVDIAHTKHQLKWSPPMPISKEMLRIVQANDAPGQ